MTNKRTYVDEHGAKAYSFEIYRQDREGWTYGKDICGNIFVGNVNDMPHAWFMEDNDENRKLLESYWKNNSFAREIKRRA